MLIVSDGFLSHGSPSAKEDNTWLHVPGVCFDVGRGRRFARHCWVPACYEVPDRVLLLTAGNDIRSATGRTRPYFPVEVLLNLEKNVCKWTALGARVFFVFCGNWNLHGLGVKDFGEVDAPDRYDARCAELRVAADKAGAIVLPTPDIATLWRMPMRDEWHFATEAKILLEEWLKTLLSVEVNWQFFGSLASSDVEEEECTLDLVDVTTHLQRSEDEQNLIRRVTAFMVIDNAEREMKLPHRLLQCTCGLACGKSWYTCCQSCWIFSEDYFKALVQMEFDTHAGSLRKLRFSTLRRLVCEDNPRIWLYINGVKRSKRLCIDLASGRNSGQAVRM